MTPPAVRPLAEWPAGNRRIYEEFCQWLRDGGYSDSTIYLYGRAARLALGLLAKDFGFLDPEADPSAVLGAGPLGALRTGPSALLRAGLDRVRETIAARYDSKATCQTYFKGLAKLAEYFRIRCGWPTPEKQVNWDYYLDSLPGWLANDARAYIIHRQRNWLPEECYRATCTLLSHLTLSLRWMAAHTELTGIEDLTPTLWLDYVDTRLGAGIRPATLNRELRDMQHFLRFLAGEGRAICARMLRVEPLKAGDRPPRDLPLDQIRRLLRQVEAEVASAPAGHRRQALLDRAWCFLMLYGGLRSGEIRRLRLADLDTSASLSAGLENRRVRIEQSKGLKDRVVCLSAETVAAIRAYLEVRGPATGDHVFLYRHRPLSPTYCSKRLRTLGRLCGVRVTPHQLRASFATLMLNAGASVLTVQALLGHKHVDTTLRYARVYGRTVAADYQWVIGETEEIFGLRGIAAPPLPDSGYRRARRYGTSWPKDSCLVNSSRVGQAPSMGDVPPSHPV
jgi:site-specific recombinase XerD